MSDSAKLVTSFCQAWSHRNVDELLAYFSDDAVYHNMPMPPIKGKPAIQAIELLAAATDNFSEQCLKGLRATERGPQMVDQGLAIATALAPVIGYDAAAEIAKEAARSGRTVREVAREQTDLSEEDLARILDPEKMTEPGLP